MLVLLCGGTVRGVKDESNVHVFEARFLGGSCTLENSCEEEKKNINFSNLLIIHEEKTMENTPVTEVWKYDLDYHKI